MDIRYAVHRPQGADDDDQGSSDQIHPPVHSDDHLRLRPEPGVGDYDRSLVSALTHCRPCNLARCFALYYASFYYRQERGVIPR
ncbi:hypothetical protein R6Q57_013900, partial [Mikania cordata]